MEVVRPSLDGLDVTFGKERGILKAFVSPVLVLCPRKFTGPPFLQVTVDFGSRRLARGAAKDCTCCKALSVSGRGENSLSGSERYFREWAQTLNQGWTFPAVLLGVSQKHQAACVFPHSPPPVPSKPLLLLFSLP